MFFQKTQSLAPCPDNVWYRQHEHINQADVRKSEMSKHSFTLSLSKRQLLHRTIPDKPQ